MRGCALCDGAHHAKGLCKPHYDRARRYRLSVADLRLIDARERCDICPRDPEVVDHDHATGAVRGVLCSDCNKALGLLRDAIPTLHAAIQYLNRSPT